MIDFYKEIKCIKNAEQKFTDINKKEIVLYGAGSLGQLAVNILEEMCVIPHMIVDLQKRNIIGRYKVVGLDDLTKEELNDCLFLICISTISYDKIIKSLATKGVKHYMHFYTYAYLQDAEVMSNGWLFDNCCQFDDAQAIDVCKILSPDEKSVAHYLQFLWWKKCNFEREYEGFPICSNEKYWGFLENKYKYKKSDVFWDVGAYKGKQTESYIENSEGKYKKVILFEPLKEAFAEINEKYACDERVLCMNIGLGDADEIISFNDRIGMASKCSPQGNAVICVNKADNINEEMSILKIHVEGFELKVLKGAIHKINKYRPIIMVLADHSIEGAYDIPLFLNSFEDYDVFFRLHDYCGNSAVYYAVPK